MNSTTLAFLRKLEKNNDREWFAKNKSAYQKALDDAKVQFAQIEELLNEIDEIEKLKVYRIYRDVRFSKNKLPYKNSFSASYVRATRQRRGGYYLHIEPGNSFAAGGFFSPEAADLKRIRKEIEADPITLPSILNQKSFKRTFGSLRSHDALKTAPRGFSVDLPGIELIRLKNYFAQHNFTDKEVLSPTFSNKVVKTFSVLHPFFNYMSDVLNSDLNGELIV